MKEDEKYEHMYYQTDYIKILKQDDKTTLKGEYDQCITDANTLKTESKGLINLNKSGSETKAALDLFDRSTKHIVSGDEIEQAEVREIDLANIGAIIFTADATYKGKAWKYDVKSMYPSIMNSGLLFPIKEGQFIKLSDDDFEEMKIAFFKYGIYRVNISSTTKLFRIHKDKRYTHFDLTRARELGLEINIIDDEQANFIHYSRE